MLVKAEIYLDANAGAPLSPAVTEALFPFLRDRGALIPNPSSIHSHGRFAKRALAEAREKVARSLGSKTDPEQLIFTSSGTEANQLVIRSVLESQAGKSHWITTPVEHDSVRQMVSWFEGLGGQVSYLPVDERGVPQVDRLPEMITDTTALVSCVWVNNETGVITDIERLSQLTRARAIPLHLDGAQAWGKIPFHVDTLGAQFVTFSGHKIGGLAGSGVLWLGRGNPIHPVILGKQEKGRRGGTENLIGLVALGAAASQVSPDHGPRLGNENGPANRPENRPESRLDELARLRDRLQNAICERIPGTRINGEGALRVANTLNLSFDGVEGDGLVMALDLAGYSVSSGSACASGVLEPSHVLLAMGKTRAQAMAAVRISFPGLLPWEELEGFVNALEKAVLRVRKAGKTSR